MLADRKAAKQVTMLSADVLTGNWVLGFIILRKIQEETGKIKWEMRQVTGI
jgi:hypothetical protein